MKKGITIIFFLLTQSIVAQTVNVKNEYEKGTTVDGYKKGSWEYYDAPGQLSLKVDYATSDLLFLTPDTTPYAIQIDSTWVWVKLDQQPRYVGSMVEFYKILCSIMRYPRQAVKNKTTGCFYVTFEIDTTGKAGNYNVINDIGDRCATEALEAFKLLTSHWFPAMKDGRSYPARFIIPFCFQMVETVDGKEVLLKQKEVKTITSLPMAKPLNQIIIKMNAPK